MRFFVTGGSRGIGAAIVEQALSEGHDVAFTYRESADRAQAILADAARTAPLCRCRADALDVRDSAAVDRVTDAVIEAFGGVEVVVVNAGITLNRLAATTSDEEWRAVIETNLSGAFYVCRSFLPAMLAEKFGRFILLSSISHRGVSGQAAYAASKAGLLGLSATFAKEYGRRGITSNVISPGLIATDMTQDATSEASRTWWMEHCPVGRSGAPADVARLVTFLASDAASFINGQVIEINGGLDWVP